MNIVEVAARLVDHLKAEGHKNPAMVRDFRENVIHVVLDTSGPPTSDMGYHTSFFDAVEIRIRDDYAYEVVGK